MNEGRLEAELGSAAFRVLDQWSRQKGFAHEFDSRMRTGRSGALVLVVDRHDQHGPSRKLILKLDSADGGDHAAVEYARHRRAVGEGGGFAAARIALLENDPLPVGGDQWITFQRIAGNDLEEFGAVRTQLSGFLGEPGGRPGAAGFGRILRRVTEGVLGEWNAGPRMTPMPVADFLKLNLGGRLAPGLPLHGHVSAVRSDRLPNGLPDPYALLAGRPAFGDRTVKAALGRCHGDLHVENVLVRTWPELDPSDFRLVDLARYESRGPLARDPVHLLLHMVAQTLHRLGPGRDALADVLIDPLSGRGDEIPGWLRTAITEVYAAGDAWIAEYSYGGDWRRQRLLSITACALMLHVRKSTRPQDRDWFLHLGARAAAAFLGPAASGRGSSSPGVTAPPPRPVGGDVASGSGDGALPAPGDGALPAPGNGVASASGDGSSPASGGGDVSAAAGGEAEGEPDGATAARRERRLALVIGVDTFADRRFRELKAPRADVRELGGVLADPDRGRFEVTVLDNPDRNGIAIGIEAFFDGAAPGDFLLLYFSGHGIKDALGRFFLVAADSTRDLLGSTCVPGADVRDWMDASLSKKIVVILDCCYAGAFPMSAKSGTPGLDVLNDLGGRGRAVLTATTGYAESFEYAGPVEPDAPAAPSVFTEQLVHGLRSGEADLDGDGAVEIGELFHFLRERVRSQSPQLKADLESPLYIADVKRRREPAAGPAGPRARTGTGDRPPRNVQATENEPFEPPPAPTGPRFQSVKVFAAVGVLMTGLMAAFLYMGNAGGDWSVGFEPVDCRTAALPVVIHNTTDGDVAFGVKVDGVNARTVTVGSGETSTVSVTLPSGRVTRVSVAGSDGRTRTSEHRADC